MPDGRDVLAAWTTLDNCNMQVTLRNATGVKGPFKTFIAGFAETERDWGAREWVGFRNNLCKKDAPLLPDLFQFTVRGRPYVMLGDFSGVQIEKVQRIDFPEMVRNSVSTIRLPSKMGIIHPSGKPAETINLGDDATNYRSLMGGAPHTQQDLDASFSLSYDKDAINLEVKVDDDVFLPKGSKGDIWQGDSVQVAFQCLDKDADRSSMTEYTLALTDNGPMAYRHFSQIKLPEGESQDVKLAIQRKGRQTIYKASFPFKELGMKNAGVNTTLGFSLLINDNDGTGRKGYLHWGDGIGDEKNPAAYGGILFKE